MSFKAEESSAHCKPDETYPCLMRAINSHKVVLFVAPGTGVVVKDPRGTDEGSTSPLWTFPLILSDWEPWHGTVTISNDTGGGS